MFAGRLLQPLQQRDARSRTLFVHDLEHRAKAYWSDRCSNCCQGQVLDNLKRRSGQVEHHTLAWQDDPVVEEPFLRAGEEVIDAGGVDRLLGQCCLQACLGVRVVGREEELFSNPSPMVADGPVGIRVQRLEGSNRGRVDAQLLAQHFQHRTRHLERGIGIPAS